MTTIIVSIVIAIWSGIGMRLAWEIGFWGSLYSGSLHRFKPKMSFMKELGWYLACGPLLWITTWVILLKFFINWLLHRRWFSF